MQESSSISSGGGGRLNQDKSEDITFSQGMYWSIIIIHSISLSITLLMYSD